MKNTIQVLDHGFVEYIDHMGDDQAIVQAARVSYGNDRKEKSRFDYVAEILGVNLNEIERVQQHDYHISVKLTGVDNEVGISLKEWNEHTKKQKDKDRNLIRYLMGHSHTTPFEMVEFKFCIQIPMDIWRQMVRHRTASINEYSTRYTEALNFFHEVAPSEWRTQSKSNKQGSDKYIDEETGRSLSKFQRLFLDNAKREYKEKLSTGVAREQARKDLPLSTYTRAYWKCDLHNIFNFLRLRLDSHAQLEIQEYAQAIYNLIRPRVPIACEAFKDYVLHAKKFSAQEMNLIRHAVKGQILLGQDAKPEFLTDREWKEFKDKIDVI